MTNVIIYDFEVFKNDILLGVLILDKNGNKRIKQMWSLDEIKDFYYSHLKDFWVGHNSDTYDNFIMQAILDNDDVYATSKRIINSQIRSKCEIEPWSYDMMACEFYSVKTTELLNGKKVYTTEVDFNLDRKLTDEEKKLTEEYNAHDLEQMYENFLELQDRISLRIDILKEFNIPKKYLTATETKLACLALHSKKIPGLEYQLLAPKMYDTLQIKNQDIIDFYLREGFRKNEKLTTMICGLEHQLGSGGIHAAIKKCHETDMIYFDVDGYYNLIMINYNLLPRTIPEDGKKLYEYMYHEALKLKGVNEAKRQVYKIVLLSVFGATMNEYTDFYDPQVGSLITITGQLFLVDLLEKLDGKIKLIQSNTDGILLKPLPEVNKQEILDIAKEWCDRTGFVVKPHDVDEIYQRDVNCYVWKSEGKIKHKGDAFKGEWTSQFPILRRQYEDKDCAIIGIGLTDYFMNHILPEQTIKNYKNELKLFQYICKKQGFKYCSFKTTDLSTNETKEETIPDINRIFARKNDGIVGMIYKSKISNGKTITSKIPNIPDNVFLYNDEILSDETVKKLQEIIDYQFYIDKIYKRISEFFTYPIIKEIKNG